MALKDQGLSVRAIAKKLKRSAGVILNFLQLKEDYGAEIPGTSAKAVQKGKKSHYKKKEQWENNFRRTFKKFTGSSVKKYLVKSSKMMRYKKRNPPTTYD